VEFPCLADWAIDYLNTGGLVRWPAYGMSLGVSRETVSSNIKCCEKKMTSQLVFGTMKWYHCGTSIKPELRRMR